MKKLTVSFTLILIVFVMNSCKEEINEQINPKPIYEQVVTIYQDGHIFIFDGEDWYYGGTYPRQYIIDLEDCYMANSNCIPTTTLFAPLPPPVDYTELYSLIDETNMNYGEKLEIAESNGHQSIKDWYFNDGGNSYLQFLSCIEQDLQNDSVTIKKFDDHYFLVKINAETYDDCPDYW